MAIAWQEHDQDVYERLGVAGRAEVEASHGNAPGARLFWLPLHMRTFVSMV